MAQNTYLLETTEGMTYLVVDDKKSVEEEFELYKNDEVGEWAKDADLISYERVD